jgi:hypothetical protein
MAPSHLDGGDGDPDSLRAVGGFNPVVTLCVAGQVEATIGLVRALRQAGVNRPAGGAGGPAGEELRVGGLRGRQRGEQLAPRNEPGRVQLTRQPVKLGSHPLESLEEIDGSHATDGSVNRVAARRVAAGAGPESSGLIVWVW